MSRLEQSIRFVRDAPGFLEACHARHGDMFTLRITAGGEWVMLGHPDLVKEVFTGSPEVFHAGEGNDVLLPLLGDHSVLLLDDDAHLRQRRLLLPPFHGRRMSRYAGLIEQATERQVATWPVGTPIATWPRLQEITLEVIMRAVFGVQDEARLAAIRDPLVTVLRRVTHPLTLASVTAIGPRRFRAIPFARRALEGADDAILRLIRERRVADDLDERDDILSMLVQATDEDGRPMGDRELRDELMTLLVAGHETTATTLAWALERLVRHPAALARLRDEVRAGEEAYLDATIKETLRLRPVLALVVRKLTTAAEIGGHRLPAGTRVAPCIRLVHQRPDLYPDPSAFRPERFLDRAPGTYTWIPFGGGVRRCLGASFAELEARRVLATIVRRVELRAAEPEPEPFRRRAITQTPGRGGRVVVVRRDWRAARSAATREPAVAGP
ncbi:MAG: cytochrome P450 [Solirubrobacteraceae bacterium]|nr:cytochrome P450 [Solirubrobacteraceae bacterium]